MAKRPDRNWQKVNSTCVNSIRHEKGKTKVEFKEDKTVYSYNDKRKRMFNDLKESASGSKGKKFNYNWRPKRRGTKGNKRR